MRKITMKMGEYQEDLQEAQQKGYTEGYEAAQAAANHDYSDGTKSAYEEVFAIIGCIGNSLQDWNVKGDPAEVIERLHRLHARTIGMHTLSDIPF